MQLWQIREYELSNNDADVRKDKVRAILVSFSMSLATNAINSLLKYSIEKLSRMERHKAATYQTSTQIIKTVVSQTINTLVIYYILN